MADTRFFAESQRAACPVCRRELTRADIKTLAPSQKFEVSDQLKFKDAMLKKKKKGKGYG